MKIAASICIGLLACHLGTEAAAEDEPQQPVNIIAESGADVGDCPSGGTLGYPPNELKGTPYFALERKSDLATKHQALTKGEQPWLNRFVGPSSSNRFYSDAQGRRFLVLWSCKEGSCSTYNVYGIYGLHDGSYAIELTEGGGRRTLGQMGHVAAVALSCAREFDDKIRQETAKKLFRGRGQ